MQTAVQLFESQSLKDTIKSQFKQIQKSDMTPDKILSELYNKLNEKYNLVTTENEIIIKADKRKNLTNVKTEVEKVLNEIEVSFDMKYLFKVMSGQNEIIVRLRRKR